MRIVLRERGSGLYLSEDNQWIEDPWKARSFSTTWEALQFCNEQKLPPTTVVMKAENSRYDVPVVDC